MVDSPLDDGADDSGDGGESEAEGYTGDPAEVYVELAETWVDYVVEDGNGDDDC